MWYESRILAGELTFRIAVSRSHLDEVWGIPLLPLRRHGRVGLLLKRAFDLLATAVLLCLCAPVLLVLAAVLRLQSGRPAIFRQLRVTGREPAHTSLSERALRGAIRLSQTAHPRLPVRRLCSTGAR